MSIIGSETGEGAKMTDVLLFGTMGDIAGIALENLSSHGLRVVSVPFPQNTFRDEFGYTRDLKKAVAQFRPRFIFPIGHPLALARYKSKLPPQTLAVVEDAGKIELLDNKVDCSRLACELGIPQPALFDSPSEVPPGTELIFKRERSFGGSGVYRPRNSVSLVNLMEHEKGSRYLIEAYIEGTDFSVDALRWNDGGECFFKASCYRSISNRGQGPATQRESADRPELVAYARTILDAIDYNGICGFDFRIQSGEGGKAYFLECNPRFTGGLGTQIASGFELPWLLYRCISP